MSGEISFKQSTLCRCLALERAQFNLITFRPRSLCFQRVDVGEQLLLLSLRRAGFAFKTAQDLLHLSTQLLISLGDLCVERTNAWVATQQRSRQVRQFGRQLRMPLT